MITLLKHINNTDVAMHVLNKALDPVTNRWEIECLWFNVVNPKHAFLIHNRIDKVSIPNDKMNDWKTTEYDYS